VPGAPAVRRGGPGREGFTLVEVLVAMLILAVGMLALEALSIGAVRAVARADRQSEYVALATDRLERTLTQVRLGQSPTSSTATVGAASVDVVVGRDTLAGWTSVAYTVAVTVTPPADPRIPLAPITMVGRAIR
jgi:type IV pilus modification protein PilV